MEPIAITKDIFFSEVHPGARVHVGGAGPSMVRAVGAVGILNDMNRAGGDYYGPGSIVEVTGRAIVSTVGPGWPETFEMDRPGGYNFFEWAGWFIVERIFAGVYFTNFYKPINNK